MKNLTRISLLLCLVLSAYSCDDLDELTEFDVTENFSSSFNIDVADGNPQMFTETASINIASNQEIQDNLNLIQNVAVDSLTYEIDNFTGSGTATVTEASLSLGATTFSIENINLQLSDLNNTIYTISDTAQLNAIANDLENNTEITASITGTVNELPVQFDVIVTLDVTVTIDVL